MQGFDGGHKVHHTTACIDECVLHIAYALHHEQAFLFGIECAVVLIFQNRCVRPNANIQVAKLACLAEELHMSAVEQVVATTYEYFHSNE